MDYNSLIEILKKDMSNQMSEGNFNFFSAEQNILNLCNKIGSNIEQDLITEFKKK